MREIHWLRSDLPRFERSHTITDDAIQIHHAFLNRSDEDARSTDEMTRLCLIRIGEPVSGAHVVEGKSFCSSCIRRSLEIFR